MTISTKTSESPIGIYLWGVLILGIILYVVIADVLLHINHRELMTTEFKEGLKNIVIGPIITGMFAAVVVGLAWHFYTSPGK